MRGKGKAAYAVILVLVSAVILFMVFGRNPDQGQINEELAGSAEVPREQHKIRQEGGKRTEHCTGNDNGCLTGHHSRDALW